jgi:hypothetical protein
MMALSKGPEKGLVAIFWSKFSKVALERLDNK